MGENKTTIENILRQAADYFEGLRSDYDYMCKQNEILKTEIEEMEDEKSHWIRTKDRLPVRNDADNYGRVLTWRLGLAMIIKHDEVIPENASHWMPLPKDPLVNKCNCGKTVDLKKLSSNFEYIGCDEETNPVFRCKDCHIDVCG